MNYNESVKANIGSDTQPHFAKLVNDLNSKISWIDENLAMCEGSLTTIIGPFMKERPVKEENDPIANNYLSKMNFNINRLQSIGERLETLRIKFQELAI